MAHAAVHVSLGLAVGMALSASQTIRRFRGGGPMAPALGRSLLLCAALGVYAWIPGLSMHLGLSHAFCTGWWMNVFLLHPWVDRFRHGQEILGGAMLLGTLGALYLLLVACVWRARRLRREIERESGRRMG